MVTHHYIMADPSRLVMFLPDGSVVTVNWDSITAYSVRDVPDS